MQFVEYTTHGGGCPIRDFMSSLHAEEKATWAARSNVILDRLPQQRLPPGWVDAITSHEPLKEFRFWGRDQPIRIIWDYGSKPGDILLLDGFYKHDAKQEKREYKRIQGLYEDWKQRQVPKAKGKRQGGKP